MGPIFHWFRFRDVNFKFHDFRLRDVIFTVYEFVPQLSLKHFLVPQASKILN
jgi:hypothetical protein